MPHKTYKFRVKDKHAAELNRLSRKVNFVWNFCNDTQKHALKWSKQWPSNWDLQKLTVGSSKELGLGSGSISAVCDQYVRSRRQFKKPYLRYRGRRSTAWVPMQGANLRLRDGKFVYAGKHYSVWLCRKIPSGIKICGGSNFSRNAKGQWFLNVVVEITTIPSENKAEIGIDLGLKDFATLSSGAKVTAPQLFRNTQERLAKAQRARKKGQARNISIKIANQRKDFHHKLSTNIVRQNGLIAVGNVNSSSLKKTRMAKSVSDAGWSSFRNMVAYKSDYAGAIFVEVDEYFTTQACSGCGAISGPKGREGLGVREWDCPCGAVHDRDVNSAKNILRLGLQTLTGAA